MSEELVARKHRGSEPPGSSRVAWSVRGTAVRPRRPLVRFTALLAALAWFCGHRSALAESLDLSVGAAFPSPTMESWLDGSGLAGGAPAFPQQPLQAGGGLTFSFRPVGTLAGLQSSNPTLYANVTNGFAAAGSYWSSQFNDDITINIDIDYPSLGAGILGSASSQTVGIYYSNVRTALNSDSKSADDQVAVANLPSGSSLSFLTNNESTGALETDNNGTANNFILDVNRANAKALGFVSGTALQPNDSLLDASISFSSNFGWDFDRSNGISSGLYDFVGVAIHEIGHAMGFSSGVDTVDVVSSPNGPSRVVELDGYRVFTVLDLYRRGSRNGGGLDFAYGGTGTSTPYFSINGGTTSLATFSTGVYNGDGRQASHWKDDLGLGIMDPTLASGQLATVTSLDLRAIDVIGYNLVVVPEPATALLVAAGLSGIAWRRRQRRRPGG